MRRNRAALVLGLAAIVCWCLCLLLGQRAGGYAAGVSVRWNPEQGLSPQRLGQVERWAKEDGAQTVPETLLWREHSGQTIQTQDTGRTCGATLTETRGRAEILYPLGFSSGWWPAQGDQKGCAVDEDTADALWGGTDVVGKTLCWNGETYIVRGVFRGAGGLVVVQGDPAGTERWNGLQLVLPDGGGREEASAWLSRAGLSGGVILDTPLFQWCLHALTLLPALLLGLWLAARLLGRLYRLRGAPLLFLSFLPVVILFLCAALWSLGPAREIPPRLIPNQWSDFAFWGGLLSQFTQTLRGLLAQPLSTWDLSLWSAALGSLALVPIAAVLTLWAAVLARMEDGKTLTAGCLLYLCAVCGVALLVRGIGGVEVGRAMWTMPLLCLAGDYLLRRHGRYVTPGREGGRGDETKEISSGRTTPET